MIQLIAFYLFATIVIASAAMVIFAGLCILIGVAPELLYQFLPYPVDYEAYTAGEKDYTALVSKMKQEGVDIAYVGGSMQGNRGGQNMIEPAAYGAAVLFGPQTWNFKETVFQMLKHDAAIQVEDQANLEREVERLVADADARSRLGAAARELILSQQGATARTIAHLDALLATRSKPVPRAA